MIESVLMTRRLGVVLAVCAFAATASADQAKPKKAPPAAKKDKAPEPPPADDQPADGSADADQGSDALPAGWTLGPKLIDLGNNTEVDLPAGLAFVDQPTTRALLEKSGDSGEGVEGMIVSPEGWRVYIDFSDQGYVDDSDANQLDADELFKSYQQGTQQQNERRRSLGVPELFVDSWSESPRYDKSSHQLLWGLNAHTPTDKVVNYFTRVLGRNGFMSLDLVADQATIAQAKTQASSVIAATRFKTGFKYEDHKSGDKSSGMGLKALILGGAGIAVFKAAKAGLIIKLLLIFKKGIILIVAGIGAFFKKIFGRGPKKEPTELPPDGPPVG